VLFIYFGGEGLKSGIQTFDLKELYVIKTNILIQIIVISAIEKYCPATI
jgi:hypothetical protein